MKVLDLFSGIGGFSLGLERAGMTTIAFCEIETFCQKILKQHWPDVPVFTDIRTLNAKDLPEQPDLVCGGYPCQPFSVAGKQRGQKDDRHLWPEMFRLIKECSPSPWVIAENVAGHIRMGLDDVLFDLESAGYITQSFVIPACAVNAPHRRDRVWIVGYPEHNGSSPSTVKGGDSKTCQRSQERKEPALKFERTSEQGDNGNVANSSSSRMQIGLSKQEQWKKGNTEKSNNGSYRQSWGKISGYWSIEPAVGRVVDGLPNRVDRIKSLGNAVVPQIPELIGRYILKVSQ